MKKLTSILFAAAFIVVANFIAHAQTPSNVSTEKLALIKEFLALSGGQDSQKMQDDMFDGQMAYAKGVISRTFDSDRSFSAADKAAFKASSEESFDRIARQFKEFLSTELRLDTIVEEVGVPIYDRNFTEAELRELIAFYKSPTGKKTISIAPEIMKETMAYMFEKVMRKLEAFMKKTVDSEVSLIKQQLAPTGTKRKGVKRS